MIIEAGLENFEDEEYLKKLIVAGSLQIGNKKIPEDIKLLAKYSYLSRFLFMECVLLGKKKPNEKIFLSKLLNMGIDDDISISEQVEVGKRLQGIIDLGQKYNLTNQGTTQQSDGYSQQDGELR